MDIATNEYGLERLFDDGASSSLPTAVDAAPAAPAHEWSDTAELIPSQLSFKGKAYGRHDRKMLNDKNGCKARYVCKSKRTLGCPGALEAVLDCDTMEVAYTVKKPHCAACDSGSLVTDNVVDVRKEMSAEAATMATEDWASSAKDIANTVLTEFQELCKTQVAKLLTYTQLQQAVYNSRRNVTITEPSPLTRWPMLRTTAATSPCSFATRSCYMGSCTRFLAGPTLSFAFRWWPLHCTCSLTVPSSVFLRDLLR